jgi:hypothetical protein
VKEWVGWQSPEARYKRNKWESGKTEQEGGKRKKERGKKENRDRETVRAFLATALEMLIVDMA